MANRRRTDFIVLHCSATRAVQDIGAKEIRSWHKARGWVDIGYHYVIRRDGRVETGRAPDTSIGSHVKGHNANSLGICLVGGLNNETYAPENNFTAAQWDSLRNLLGRVCKKFPGAKVLGHRDFAGVHKDCPCFDARAWARKSFFPV